MHLNWLFFFHSVPIFYQKGKTNHAFYIIDFGFDKIRFASARFDNHSITRISALYFGIPSLGNNVCNNK